MKSNKGLQPQPTGTPHISPNGIQEFITFYQVDVSNLKRNLNNKNLFVTNIWYTFDEGTNADKVE